MKKLEQLFGMSGNKYFSNSMKKNPVQNKRKQKLENVFVMNQKSMKKNPLQNKSHLPPPVPPPPPPLSQQQKCNLAKYEKMRRMGIPKTSIRHKMKTDCISSNVIAEFWEEDHLSNKNTSVNKIDSISRAALFDSIRTGKQLSKITDRKTKSKSKREPRPMSLMEQMKLRSQNKLKARNSLMHGAQKPMSLMDQLKARNSLMHGAQKPLVSEILNKIDLSKPNL
eukprot:281537_1